MSDRAQGSTLPASLPRLERKAVEALTDWTAMAQGAFSTNTIVTAVLRKVGQWIELPETE
jgi:hypothetical protein